MEVTLIALTTEGDVIMQTEGELADAIGEQVMIASGMKDAYVEPFGNGGFYTILMIKENGTVSAVNMMKLREEKSVEVMDNLGGLEDVVSIEGDVTVDAHVVYAIQGSGERTMLDPYLQ